MNSLTGVTKRNITAMAECRVEASLRLSRSPLIGMNYVLGAPINPQERRVGVLRNTESNVNNLLLLYHGLRPVPQSINIAEGHQKCEHL